MTIESREDIKKLGTILVVAAHPDDETFIMGGILAAATANGQKVVVITATRGEKGVQLNDRRWIPEKMGKIREDELKAALDILGIKSQHFLGYVDNECADVDQQEAIGRVADYVREIEPDSIFTFGPDGLTGHPDHKTVSSWASAARQQENSQAKIYHVVLTREQFNIYAAIDDQLKIFFTNVKPAEPDVALAVNLWLDDEIFGKKIAALQAMPSQYENLFAKFDPHSSRLGFGIEAFVEA